MTYISTSALLFFTVFASNATRNPFAATTEPRSLLRSSQEQVPLEADVLPPKRKLEDTMMPPEGCSIRCLQERNHIYRFAGGELHLYPTGLIASSWNTNWREDLFDIDCSEFLIGTPMTMNYDALPTSRDNIWSSRAPRVTAGADQDICEVVQNLPRRLAYEKNDRDNECEAAQWADEFFEVKHPMFMDKVSSRVQQLDIPQQDLCSVSPTPGSQPDPLMLTAACVAVASECLLACISSTQYDLNCFPACEAAEAICYGRRGPSSSSSQTDVPSPPPDNILHLGGDNTCVTMYTGELYCGGRNDYHQLLDDGEHHIHIMMSSFLRLFPHDPVQIVFSEGHTCMIMKNGELRCWGWSFYGQLGLGNTKGDKVTLVGNVGAAQITVGDRHTCAIDINNSVQCWGYNMKGQLGLGNKEKQRNTPTIVVLEGGVGATQIAAGHSHTCAIDTNNSVQCWGGYHNGQLGLGDTPTERLIPTIITLDRGVGAVQIGVGSSHCCVLDNTGSVQCWQENKYGNSHSTQHIPTTIPLGEGTLVTQFGVGSSHACALVDDTKNPLKCWGEYYSPTNVVLPMGGVVTELKTGLNHNCIVVVDVAKKVFCWGSNENGQLGVGTGMWGNRDDNIIHQTGFINLVNPGDRYEQNDNLQFADKLINSFDINGNEE